MEKGREKREERKKKRWQRLLASCSRRAMNKKCMSATGARYERPYNERKTEKATATALVLSFCVSKTCETCEKAVTVALFLMLFLNDLTGETNDASALRLVCQDFVFSTSPCLV
jgi:hypothetical protein